MSRARPRVAFFGLFGTGNFGNEGSLNALHLALREALPDASFQCICADPKAVLADHGLPSVPINRAGFTMGWLRIVDRITLGMLSRLANVAHTIRTVRNLDALIVPGTGVLDDFGEGPTGVPYDLFRWCVLARLFGVRIALVSIGAGPIRHPLSRKLMLAAARMATVRSYRDGVSLAFVKDHGLRADDDAVTPDLAFILPAPDPAAPTADARRIIGVGLMSYYGWRPGLPDSAQTYADYLEKISTFVHWLLSTGWETRLIIGDDADSHVVEDVITAVTAKGATPNAALSASTVASLADVMTAMADVDAVVATRFHNVVCALKTGKPTISIGYSSKNRALLESVGLGDFALDIETFTPDELRVKLDALIADTESLHDGVMHGVSSYRNELVAHVRHVIAKLGLDPR